MGQEATKPPCKETPVSTRTSVPPSITNPSTTSKLSNSQCRNANDGKYQPGCGARRRTRLAHPTPLCAPGCARWCEPQEDRSVLGSTTLVEWPLRQILRDCYTGATGGVSR